MNGNEFFHSTISEQDDGTASTGTQGYGVCRPLNQENHTIFGQVSNVIANTVENILLVTVPTDEDWYLQRVAFSGSNSGVYDLWVDSLILDRVHIWFGAQLSGVMEFAGYPSYGRLVTRGSTITVKVKHSRPHVGDFNARLQWMVKKQPVVVGQGSTAFSDP